MIYVRNKKIYVFHFPKTGGLFLRKVLAVLGMAYSQVGNQHDSPGRPVNFDVGERGFVFMRKPSEWLWSYWRYRAFSGDLSPCEPWIVYHPTRELDASLSFSYTTFLNNLIDLHFVPLKKMYYDFKPVKNKIDFKDLTKGISELLEVDESIIRNIAPENVSKKAELPELTEQQRAELDRLDNWFYTEIINL